MGGLPDFSTNYPSPLNPRGLSFILWLLPSLYFYPRASTGFKKRDSM